MKKLALVPVLFALSIAVPANAQDLKPERMTDVTWHMVEFLKFQPGKRARGMEMIEKYFAAADRDLGREGQVVDVHFNTGEWDSIVIFPMSGGPGDLSWAMSPDDVKWMTALAKRTGGMDQARALLAEWDTLLAAQARQVAHRHPKW